MFQVNSQSKITLINNKWQFWHPLAKKHDSEKKKSVFITLFRNREASLRSAPTCGEKGMLLHSWWQRILVQSLWKIGWRVLKKKKKKLELPYDPTISLLSIHTDKINLKRYRHSYIHSNTIYNSQYKETA